MPNLTIPDAYSSDDEDPQPPDPPDIPDAISVPEHSLASDIPHTEPYASAPVQPSTPPSSDVETEIADSSQTDNDNTQSVRLRPRRNIHKQVRFDDFVM